MAAPAFYQQLEYDRADDRIVFQRYQIRVIESDNQKMKYVIEGQ